MLTALFVSASFVHTLRTRRHRLEQQTAFTQSSVMHCRFFRQSCLSYGSTQTPLW